MKAIQLVEPKQFRVIDVPEPPPPGPGEAVVRVYRVGVCGTDFSGYLGKMPFFSYPRIPGHELGVEVVAVGAGVTNVKPGDRCAVVPVLVYTMFGFAGSIDIIGVASEHSWSVSGVQFAPASVDFHTPPLSAPT